MQSRWSHYKERAVAMRKRGKSLGDIERFFGIPRSTLSGWFKGIKLSDSHKKKLEEKKLSSLNKARKLAVKWHNDQKDKRLQIAEDDAEITLKNVNPTEAVIELVLAALYLGEGFKKSPRTGMGNSDPLLLKFFLHSLLNIYKVSMDKIKFELHIRCDQDPEEIKKYWAHELKVPVSKFTSISIDQRTLGKPTYSDYKGVCVVVCSPIAIQRKLVHIGRKFCERITQTTRD